jgi:hypothetical protein
MINMMSLVVFFILYLTAYKNIYSGTNSHHYIV